ncbi:MAG: hypothetical protein ACKV2V_18890 [Blastocatellia bacterium]
MKKTFPTLLLIIVSIAITARHIHAQEGRPRGDRGPGGPGGGDFMRFDRALAAINTNRDTMISADEISDAAAALRTLDKNGDGQLTEDELRPEFPGGRPGGPEGRPGAGMSDEMVNTLMEFDGNKDGKLAQSEVPERMQGLFGRSDANKDGFLTREELKKSAESPSDPAAGGPGGREGMRGGGPGERGGFMRMSPSLQAINTDQNEVISGAEINNAPAALRALDKNNDGALRAGEIRPNFGPGGRGGRGGGNPDEMINHLFEENDTNNDGKLSEAEAPERMREMFSRADENKDGFLTKDEMKKAFAQGGGPGRPREN